MRTDPVLLIRSEGNDSDASSLAEVGLMSISEPYVEIKAMADSADAEKLLHILAGDISQVWFLVTSPMTMRSLAEVVGDARLRAALASAQERGLRSGTTGERTAATMREYGLSGIHIPAKASAADLAAELVPHGPAAALFPCGTLALETLPRTLKEAGWTVVQAVVYSTGVVDTEPLSAALVRDGRISAIVFRSPSAVRALLTFVTPAADIPIVCAGETTAAEARRLGLTVAAVPESPSPPIVARTVAEVLATI